MIILKSAIAISTVAEILTIFAKIDTYEASTNLHHPCGNLALYSSDAQVYLSPSIEVGTGYNTNTDVRWTNLDKVSYQNVSLNAGYLFHQKVGLFTGIGMSTYSHNFVNWDGFSWLTVVEQNRLEIPLFFHY